MECPRFLLVFVGGSKQSTTSKEAVVRLRVYVSMEGFPWGKKGFLFFLLTGLFDEHSSGDQVISTGPDEVWFRLTLDTAQSVCLSFLFFSFLNRSFFFDKDCSLERH